MTFAVRDNPRTRNHGKSHPSELFVAATFKTTFLFQREVRDKKTNKEKDGIKRDVMW